MPIILITGATAGFGQATARRFARAGWSVVGTGRREERLRALAGEIGPAFHGLAFDITDPAAVAAALDSLPDAFAAIDLLVNNAGMALGTAPAPEPPLADWQAMVETNVSGLLAVTHRLLPGLIARKGMIVNLSSIAAHWPYPGGNVYAATKAFVRQFSLGLRADLHGTGVRVTSLEPGLCESEFTMIRTRGNQAAYDALYEGADPIQPEDIAETIHWLATQPPHLNFNSIEMMPVSQSWAPLRVHRRETDRA
ncbi:malonic semialdehyde reductase [Haematobacter missouriensis]|uniref:NAD(P)-dependent oxidoreductase n=1 Tax=Haematobacter missouriensis TaxID=366616 RepID=A0A212ARZ4_9RHOB|nr:SDR family oxidoreductase [Haematobacter missouriensis]KFI33778.1 malonic semialdehyde reductase [Haematobacter missouriensis]OWJ77708.1 NAD(P)-dependent oxidoreductase [Haematobacter missouriensis]OWJ84205.1 NAD(P)-dependent oxidoreductase [Haematobacter missouriensis]